MPRIFFYAVISMAFSKIEEFDQVLLQLMDTETRLHKLLMATAFEKQPVNLEVIANKLGITKKTVANNLSILVKFGIVYREKKNTYRTDLKMISIIRMLALLKSQIKSK